MTGMTETDARSNGGQPDLSRLFVALDFDGTITEVDCNEVVLRRHTDMRWYALEEASATGLVGHAEALRHQIKMLDIPREQVLREFAEAAVLRTGFADFLRWLIRGGARPVVISAGFREGIAAVWRREGLPPIDVYASELRGGPGESFEVVINEAFADCAACGQSACKTGVLDALQRPDDVLVVFGDGVSDLCLARRADLVFARATLADLCQREGIPWQPLDSFTVAQAKLMSLAAEGFFAARETPVNEGRAASDATARSTRRS